MEAIIEHAASIDVRPASPQAGVAAPWAIVQTRSRQEKAVGRLFASLGVEHYLPLVTRWRHWGSKRRSVKLPLFPGYVFFQGRPDAAYTAISAKRAVRVIEAGDQTRLESELAQVRFAISSGAAIELCERRIVPGVGVRVRSGPLKGLEGVVDRSAGWRRVLLLVNALGQAASVEVDADALEVID